jgi:hypothetical protein
MPYLRDLRQFNFVLLYHHKISARHVSGNITVLKHNCYKQYRTNTGNGVILL